MKKILGTTLVAMALASGIMAESFSSDKTPKQIENSQKFLSFIDIAKVTSCPQYKQIADYRHINSHDEVVFVKPTVVKSKTFKDGLAVTIFACSDPDGNLQLKINNTFYKTIQD